MTDRSIGEQIQTHNVEEVGFEPHTGLTSRDGYIELLCCPITRTRLLWESSDVLISECGMYRYSFLDGIFHLLTPLPDKAIVNEALRTEKRRTQSYYDEFGWQEREGGYKEVKAFTDERATPWAYTSRCIRRVGRHIRPSGRFLLDVASGPIPYDEYLAFHSGFYRRVCVDVSIEALRRARDKLGSRGIYILGDMTKLPIASNSIDAAVSFHTVYHIPEDEQEGAFIELHRVLSDDSVGAVVYSWGYSPINSRLLRALDYLKIPPAPGTAGKGLYYHPHEKEWFIAKKWPFHYKIYAWRIVGSSALQRMGNGAFFAILYRIFYGLENLFPDFFGRHGQYPTIVIRKGRTANQP